jgi:hypothetical protein
LDPREQLATESPSPHRENWKEVSQGFLFSGRLCLAEGHLVLHCIVFSNLFHGATPVNSPSIARLGVGVGINCCCCCCNNLLLSINAIFWVIFLYFYALQQLIATSFLPIYFVSSVTIEDVRNKEDAEIRVCLQVDLSHSLVPVLNAQAGNQLLDNHTMRCGRLQACGRAYAAHVAQTCCWRPPLSHARDSPPDAESLCFIRIFLDSSVLFV